MMCSVEGPRYQAGADPAAEKGGGPKLLTNNGGSRGLGLGLGLGKF